MSTPTKTLEQLQKEADAAIAALNAGKKLKMENDRKAFKTKLESAQTAFNELDKDSQLAALEDESIKELFAVFGLVKRKTSKRGGGGSNVSYDEKAILDLLANGPKLQKDIMAHFKTTRQTIKDWQKKLVAAGKIKVTTSAKSKLLKQWELL